ncbi:SprT-like domain-containing protein [Kordia algicida OT-1]|nr:SprT family zinc-dependent metalloprotease [Kordia algicida]
MFALLLFLFSCSNDEFGEAEKTKSHLSTDLRVQYKRGNNVSTSAINYIRERTNNTFRVDTKKGRIKLNNSQSFSKSDELGTVDTSKEIVVVNETNTKHTFKVITPQEPLNTITNLIIVEKGNDSYEYFLKYTFSGELPINEETGTIDFSKFNGTIETFNASGDLIGSMTIENSIITSDQGQLSPCPDDNQDPNDDDDTNAGSNSSGSDSSTGIPNDDTDEDPVNAGNGDPDSSAQFTDPNGDCGLTFSYEQCGCGGDANGHAPQAGYDCCQGSPLVIRDCNGTIIAQRNSGTSTTMFKRNVFDPCDDGDVGVILDDDVLCGMNDENFNAYYSNKSPFNVDLSQVRKHCDSINFPDPANEKFMCIYNKLIKTPLYKNMIENTFGENQSNLHLTFVMVDTLSRSSAGRTDKMPGTNPTRNTQTGIVNLHLRIRISKEYMENYSAIAVAKTILHETIHSYLMVKHVNCNQGTPIDEIIEELNNKSFEELMEYYFNNACDGQEQHEFMYDKMLPVFRNILSSIRDELIPPAHVEAAELDDTFINESNPNGDTVAFNWNEFYKYLSLQGLQNTNYFANNILNNPHKYSNYLRYADEYGRFLFEKDCIN